MPWLLMPWLIASPGYHQPWLQDKLVHVFHGEWHRLPAPAQICVTIENGSIFWYFLKSMTHKRQLIIMPSWVTYGVDILVFWKKFIMLLWDCFLIVRYNLFVALHSLWNPKAVWTLIVRTTMCTLPPPLWYGLWWIWHGVYNRRRLTSTLNLSR